MASTLFEEPKVVPAPVILRPYQEKAVAAWHAFGDRGGRRGLIVAATGSGKTCIMNAIIRDEAKDDLGFSALAIAHRKELLEQIRGTTEWINPHLPCSIHSGDMKAERGSQIVAASVQSIGQPYSEALSWLGPRLVIADEAHHCFVAGTLVDGKPIEAYAVGDAILAFDHWQHEVVLSSVVAVMKNKPKALIRVRLSSGASFICTPEHPIFNVTGDNYWPAKDMLLKPCIQINDSITAKKDVHEDANLPRVSFGVQIPEPTDLLLSRVPGDQSKQGLRYDVSGVPEAGSLQHEASEGTRSEGQSLLLGGMLSLHPPRGSKCDDDADQSEVCVRENEAQQSNEAQGIAGADEINSSGDGASTYLAGRECQGTDGATGVDASGSGQALDAGARGPDSQAKGGGLSDSLQTRSGAPGNDDLLGDRRTVASEPGSETTGPEEGWVSACAWVDCIEVLQPGSDGTYGGLCPDGYVYNLEVAEFNNYFAEGVLVHNCAADTYQRVFTRFGCYDEVGASLLGVTATPHRLDNKALVGDTNQAIFEEIVFRYDIVAAIKDGFLVDLKGYRAAINIDLSKVKTVGGDYVQNQLEEVMNVDPVNHLAYESWCNAAGGRQTIIFCSGVDHAKAVAEVFNDKGVKAAAVYGDMPMHERLSAINAFRDGQIKVLTNMDILTEGFDARECGCVILLRPTKSWSLFTQMVGRGLRTLPGVIDGIEFEPSEQRRSAIQGSKKPDCVVIDIVGLTDAHQVNERKNGDGEPSLNALVGLPEGLDLEGKTVVEALEAFEELPEIVKAAAGRKRKLNFSELTAVLSQVEMLSEIESPEEAADSDLYWLKTGDLSYRLDCGSDRPEEGETYGVARSATLQGDILGNWQLLLKSKHRDETHDMPDDLQHAFVVADGIIRKTFYGVANLASKKAVWRMGEPTPPQRQFLQAKGIDPAVIAQLTKGSASAMIGLIKGREASGGN